MPSEIIINRLVTGWLESPEEVSLMNSGKHPDVDGGQIKSYGWQPEIKRSSGAIGSGTMVPAPAWLIQTESLNILVDTGMGDANEVEEVQKKYGLDLYNITPPENDITHQLKNFGLAEKDIDLVLHTHLHFDHVGASERFVNARFIVHKDEIPWALCPPPYGVYYYQEFSHHVKSVIDQFEFITSDKQITPNIRLVYTGGHSPGHCVVFVKKANSTICICGDAVYNYKNLEHEWPQGPVFDIYAQMEAMQKIKHADIILLNHDPIFDNLFPDGKFELSTIPDTTRLYMEKLKTIGSFRNTSGI